MTATNILSIEPTDTFSAEPGEQKTADHRSDNSEHYVQNNPLARFVDNLAGYEACNESAPELTSQ